MEVREYIAWRNLNMGFKCINCEFPLNFYDYKKYPTGASVVILQCPTCKYLMYVWCGLKPKQEYIGVLSNWLKQKKKK